MNKRKNKIWGVVRDGKYEDYEDELINWELQKNKKIISTLRNNEADEDIKGIHTIFCPYCEKPVCVRYQKSVQFPYIKHKFNNDSRNCIFEDENKEEICKNIVRARKYEGRTTGHLHKKVVSQLKQIIELSPHYKLLKSPEGKRLYHKNGSKEYRIPDLFFSYGNERIVIEVQNSPEWIKVIAERNKFYKENSIHLIWVFTKNSLIKNSVSSIDISSRQKFNAFSFNDECYCQSNKNKEINFLCSYEAAYCNFKNNAYQESSALKREMIALSDLNFSIDSMPYFYDLEKESGFFQKECHLKNSLKNEYNVGYHPPDFNDTYYKHMIESVYFAKFRYIPEYIIGKPIQRLNNIAQCYIAVIYLLTFLKKYNSLKFALSFDKSGKLRQKLENAVKFWRAVKNSDFEAVEMLEANQRTTPNTIRGWKKMLTSDMNQSALVLSEFEEINHKVLRLIQSFEENTLPYVAQ